MDHYQERERERERGREGGREGEAIAVGKGTRQKIGKWNQMIPRQNCWHSETRRPNVRTTRIQRVPDLLRNIDPHRRVSVFHSELHSSHSELVRTHDFLAYMGPTLQRYGSYKTQDAGTV